MTITTQEPATRGRSCVIDDRPAPTKPRKAAYRATRPAAFPLPVPVCPPPTAPPVDIYFTSYCGGIEVLCADADLRPLHWRWRLASCLVDGITGFPGDWIDPWVRRARTYLEALHRCRGANDHVVLTQNQPDVASAFALYREPGWGRCEEAEARLLARQPSAEIASRLGLLPGVVDAYEHLFFHVRDRLEGRSYIVRHAVGPRLHGDPARLDLGTLARHVGYFQGRSALDALVETFTRPVARESWPPGKGVDAERARSRIEVKLWVTTFLLFGYCQNLAPPAPVLRLAARPEFRLPLVHDPETTVLRLRSSVRALRELVGHKRAGYSPVLRVLFAELPLSRPFRKLVGPMWAHNGPVLEVFFGGLPVLSRQPTNESLEAEGETHDITM